MRKQANTNINSQKFNPDPLLGYKERKKKREKEQGKRRDSESNNRNFETRIWVFNVKKIESQSMH